MKIVNIEDYFHPEAGYQSNVLSKYLVKFGHEVSVVTPEPQKLPSWFTSFFDIKDIEKKDAEFTASTGIKIIRVPIHAYKSGRAIYKRGIQKTVDGLNPDLVFIHSEASLMTMSHLLRYKFLKYALLLDSHMLAIASRNKCARLFHFFYRHTFAKIINRNKIQVIRTQDCDFSSASLGISEDLLPFISFGSDTILFRPDDNVKAAFRREHGIADDDFVVVYAGKLTATKGGLLLAEALRKKFENAAKNIVFVVVGTLGSSDYAKKVAEGFEKSENRILRFPAQKYMELPKFFQCADLAIVPRENSLLFYDEQACGLPVILTDDELNKLRLKCNNGFNFKSGNAADLRQKIVDCCNMDKEKFAEMKNNALQNVLKNYNYEDIARQYEAVMISEYERQKAEKHF